MGGLLALQIFDKAKSKNIIQHTDNYQENRAEYLTQNKEISRPVVQDIDYYRSLIHIFISYGLALLLLEMIEILLWYWRSWTGLNLLVLMDTLHSVSFVFCALAIMAFIRLYCMISPVWEYQTRAGFKSFFTGNRK